MNKIQDCVDEIHKQIKHLYVNASQVLAFDEGYNIFIRLPWRLTVSELSDLINILKNANINALVCLDGQIMTSVAQIDM